MNDIQALIDALLEQGYTEADINAALTQFFEGGNEEAPMSQEEIEDDPQLAPATEGADVAGYDPHDPNNPANHTSEDDWIKSSRAPADFYVRGAPDLGARRYTAPGLKAMLTQDEARRAHQAQKRILK